MRRSRASGEIGDEMSQLAGGVGGERGLQPRLVLLHHEVALSQRLSELVRGPLPLAIACADGRCDWGGRVCHDERLTYLDSA